jgi:hypothetical protein
LTVIVIVEPGAPCPVVVTLTDGAAATPLHCVALDGTARPLTLSIVQPFGTCTVTQAASGTGAEARVVVFCGGAGALDVRECVGVGRGVLRCVARAVLLGVLAGGATTSGCGGAGVVVRCGFVDGTGRGDAEVARGDATDVGSGAAAGVFVGSGRCAAAVCAGPPAPLVAA